MTRPARQATEFAQRLREAGAEPIVAPTIAIGPPRDPAAARAAVSRAREYAWAVFTSRNGVDAFFKILAELRGDGSAPLEARGAVADAHVAAKTPSDADLANAAAGPRIAAIGPKTARALTTRGVHVDMIPAEYVNEAVAAALLERTAPGDRVVVYRAQEARDVLPAMLRERGRVVDVAALYATRFVDDPGLSAKAARADIVTFASASSVNGFVHNVPDAATALARKTVAAIGPITAKAARDAGIRVDAIADEFTVDGLIRALHATVVLTSD